MRSNFWKEPKSKRIAIIITLLGTVTPVAGLHKFYLGQPLWGIIYLLLWTTPIPHFACAVDAAWYLLQSQEDFDNRFNYSQFTSNLEDNSNFNQETSLSRQVEDLAQALRQLEQLKQDGLLLEDEFEQKRRQLIGNQ